MTAKGGLRWQGPEGGQAGALEDWLARSIIRLTGALCLEAKTSPRNTESLKVLFTDPASAAFVIYSSEMTKANSEDTDRINVLRAFIDTYFNGNIDLVPALPSVYRYTVDGLLDAGTFTSEVKQVSDATHETTLAPEERFVRDLYSFSDEEINSIAAGLINDVRELRQRSPLKMARSLSTLLYCAEQRLFPIPKRNY